jgi:small subunit ribosomal protein S2
VHREETAIHEANLLNIPVIALVDTNCDPTNIDYVVPSNDDAIRAIKLLVGKIADACQEGKAMRKEEEIEAVAEKAVAMVEEPELSDEELLGEATLAKLTGRSVLIKAEDEEVIFEGLEIEGFEEIAEAEEEIVEAEAAEEEIVEAEAEEEIVEAEAEEEIVEAEAVEGEEWEGEPELEEHDTEDEE